MQAMYDIVGNELNLLRAWNRPEAQWRCYRQPEVSPEEIEAKERRNDFMGAYAVGQVRAKDRIFCALAQEEGLLRPDRDGKQPVRMPFEASVVYIGANLARSARSMKNSGLPMPESTKADVAYARLFLEYAASAGVPGARENLDALMADFFDQPVTPSTPTNTTPVVEAVSINNEFLSNKFAFNQKYDGKPMRIRGVVDRISSDGSSVMLVGTSNVPAESRGNQHYVYCELNPDVRSTVGSLRVNANATIAGRYDASFKQLGFYSYLTLVDCQVVP